jgi:hypothetical protein
MGLVVFDEIGDIDGPSRFLSRNRILAGGTERLWRATQGSLMKCGISIEELVQN